MATIHDGIIKIWSLKNYTLKKIIEIDKENSKIYFSYDGQFLISFNEHKPSNIVIIKSLTY